MRHSVAVGEALHLVELLPAVLALPLVRGQPARPARGTRAGAVVHGEAGAPVDPELLQRGLQLLGVQVQAAGQAAFGPRLRPEAGEHPAQHVRVRVVAVVEELVGAAVVPGVEEDGPAGPAVAAGAADLLVVALEAAGQRGVDDRAHVRLVDAHAERDGGDDHLEPSAEEAGLHAVAGAVAMPAW